MATALSVDRKDFDRLFKALGHTNPQKWDADKAMSQLEALPKYLKTHPADVSGDDEKLLEEILDALDLDQNIELSLPDEMEEEPEEEAPKAKVEANGHGKTRGRKPKKTVQEEDEPSADGDGEEEEAPKAKEIPEEELPVKHLPFSYEKTSDKLIKLSPSLVEKFFSMDAFPRDRDLQKNRVNYHRRNLENGEFTGATWASIHVEDMDKTFRGNGKHTSFVLNEWLEKGETLPDCNIRVEEYTCPTLRDAAGLFQTFDPKASVRNKADVLRTFSSTTKATEAMPSRVLSVLTTGIAFSEHEKVYRKIPTVDQAMTMLSKTKFNNWFRDLIMADGKKGLKEKKHLIRMSVVAAMYQTYKSDPETATEFWEKIRDKGGDDKANSPPRKLYDWLIKSKVGGREGKGRVSEREVYISCLQAWNAYKAEEDTVTFKYKEEMNTPEVA